MSITTQKKEIVHYFLKKNVFLSPDLISRLDKEESVKKAYSLMQHNTLTEETLSQIFHQTRQPISQKQPQDQGKVKIKINHVDEPRKRTLSDFISIFKSRYTHLSRILQDRQELSGPTSILRVKSNKERETVAVIGLVLDKTMTKNGNIMLTIEDPTGTLKVLVSKNKPDMIEEAKDIVFDEVIGVVGTSGDNILFANSLYHPDIPLTKELKKGPVEEYAVFISDIHVGSNDFLQKEFEKFLSWISGNTGTDEQKHTAKKVKYLFIIGDLVDGVGIYPGQEEELTQKDIAEQYQEFARYLSLVPKHIRIIICPGNHDAMRLAEPQLAVYPDIAKELYNLPNVIMVSNPSLINIGSTATFEGFDVLMYHGYSFDYYASNVESIRNNGGYDRSDLIMKFMLQRRHLAPTHTSTLYIPQEEDHLIIRDIPDFFVTGHIHKSCVANYRNITMLSGSCFQDTTAFQVKVGHHPEPGRVPVINLQTRKVKMMRFT